MKKDKLARFRLMRRAKSVIRKLFQLQEKYKKYQEELNLTNE